MILLLICIWKTIPIIPLILSPLPVQNSSGGFLYTELFIVIFGSILIIITILQLGKECTKFNCMLRGTPKITSQKILLYVQEKHMPKMEIKKLKTCSTSDRYFISNVCITKSCSIFLLGKKAEKLNNTEEELRCNTYSEDKGKGTLN